MSDIVKVKVSISTNKVGSECTEILEFDSEEWEEMCDKTREEVCKEAAFEMMEWYWSEE